MSSFGKYFYKSSSLEKGRIYTMMEESILENINLLNLSDLTKITQNLLSHNIGSNHF